MNDLYLYRAVRILLECILVATYFGLQERITWPPKVSGCIHQLCVYAAADPGYPIGGETNWTVWAPTYYLAQICRKLLENENKMDREGVSSPKFYYVDSTTGIRKRLFIIFKFLIAISKRSDATSQVTSPIVSRARQQQHSKY